MDPDLPPTSRPRPTAFTAANRRPLSCPGLAAALRKNRPCPLPG